MNINDWFPLGWTGWISLQSKGLLRVFSNTTVWKHKFFGAQPSLWSNPHIHTWLLESESVSHTVVSDSCSPMDCSPPGSSVRAILQARILEWVAISFSRGSSWLRDWTWVSGIVGRFFTVRAIAVTYMDLCHSLHKQQNRKQLYHKCLSGVIIGQRGIKESLIKECDQCPFKHCPEASAGARLDPYACWWVGDSLHRK